MGNRGLCMRDYRGITTGIHSVIPWPQGEVVCDLIGDKCIKAPLGRSKMLQATFQLTFIGLGPFWGVGSTKELSLYMLTSHSANNRTLTTIFCRGFFEKDTAGFRVPLKGYGSM